MMGDKFFGTIKMLSGRRAGTLGALALLGATCGFSAGAQVVKAPRYTGGIDAPTQQVNLPALPAALTAHGTVVEDVVVRVNDQIISRSDVERSQQLLVQEAQEQHTPEYEQAQKQKDMLRDMIDQQLLLSKAKELGLNADADVIRQLDDIRKQNKMDSMDDLERAAKSQGVSFEDFKAKIRNQILTQQVVRDEVGRRLQMSPADEAKYYSDHKNEFQQPEQVRLSEILVPLPETATPAEIVQAERKANELKTQIMKGDDFAAIAKKSSGGPTAQQGGELGMFKRGALAKVLEDQTFDLKSGETTQPIRTRQGFVILKVTAHDQAGPAALKDVEPQIQEALYMNAMQPALRAYLTKLREQSYVDIQPGFIDSGASSRETKPVFTAYAPPPVKKKKVKSKARFDRGGHFSTVAAQKSVVASPDTTGGRTLTGAESATTESAANVDTSTGLARISAPAKPNGKPGKVKREKIRFGQAPRTALADGDVAADASAPVSQPAATAPAPSGLLGGVSSDAPAVASTSADLTDNPLTPVAPTRTKTRFAAKAGEVKEKKAKIVTAKQQEKAIATATPATTDEKLAQQTQAAPLGLGGDTSKKLKKPAKVKGAPKQRLEDKKKTEPAAPQTVDQTANPALAPTADTPASTRPAGTPASTGTDRQPSSTAPTQAPQTVPNSSVPRSVPKESDTTLPPVTQPVPGQTQTGQPVPGTNPPN